MGYFAYDTIYGHLKKYNDTQMLIHHIFSLVTVAWCYFNNKYGQEMLLALVQGELTGAILNLNGILKAIDYPEDFTLKLDLIFLGIFVFLRPTFCYQTLINIQSNKDTDIVYKTIPSVVWYLSMDWCWMMINKASKILHQVELNFLNFFLG